jgi:hypothetical protein
MQQPSDPPYRQPPIRQAPTRRGGAAGIAIAAFAVLGAILGLMAPPFLFAVLTGRQAPSLGLGWLIPMWLGLCGGIWFGFWVTRRR